MRIRRSAALLVLAVGLSAFAAMTAGAQVQPASVAGGGSLNGQVVELPQGGALGAVYSVYYRNDTTAPIEVEFFSEAPPGVSVLPTTEKVSVAPGTTERIFYAVRVGPEIAPGDYGVKTGLRPVVAPKSGVEITTAFATEFPLRVTGAGSQLTVRVRDLARGVPAEGTISIARIGEQGNSLVITKTEGSELSSAVSPGDYEVKFDLGGKTLARRTVAVRADQPVDVELEVATIVFDDLRVTRNDTNGALATVDVIGVIDNDLGVIPRAETNLIVTLNGEPLDTVALKSFAPLPEGLQEVSGRYVPARGWVDGEYGFALELLGDDLAVRSAQPVTLTVGAVPSVDASARVLPEGLEPWMLAAAGGALVLLIVLVVLVRRRRVPPVTAGAKATRADKRVRPRAERAVAKSQRTGAKEPRSRRSGKRTARDNPPTEPARPPAAPPPPSPIEVALSPTAVDPSLTAASALAEPPPPGAPPGSETASAASTPASPPAAPVAPLPPLVSPRVVSSEVPRWREPVAPGSDSAPPVVAPPDSIPAPPAAVPDDSRPRWARNEGEPAHPRV